jgi:hypothetical protein
MGIDKGSKATRRAALVVGMTWSLGCGFAASAYAQDNELEVTLEVLDDVSDIDAVLLSIEDEHEDSGDREDRDGERHDSDDTFGGDRDNHDETDDLGHDDGLDGGDDEEHESDLEDHDRNEDEGDDQTEFEHDDGLDDATEL